MSPEESDKKDNDKKDKRRLPPYDSEASKRLGGDPTTDAPQPLLKKDNENKKEDNKKNNKADSKKDNKEEQKD